MFSRTMSGLKRSKSFDSLNWEFGEQNKRCNDCFYDQKHDIHNHREASVIITIDNRSECSSLTEEKPDASEDSNNFYVVTKFIASIEYKIDKINDILLEQHNLLTSLKEDLTSCNVEQNTRNEPMPQYITPTESLESLGQLIRSLESTGTPDGANNRAKTLLDAIELKHSQFLDLQIREVLSQFLQSDGLKDHVTTAALESLKLIISNYFSDTFPNAYLPILENSYRRLFKHVTNVLENAFNELEKKSSTLYRSANRTSRTLRAALEEHQGLLEASRPSRNMLRNLQSTLDDVLNAEMKEWRHSLLRVLYEQCTDGEAAEEPAADGPRVPPSPPQPADPERSIIDQLMKSAEINKNIREGHINKSFEEALSSADLSLVTAACRAAEPEVVFAEPCALRQPVLLSLLQQLATDMVHDTQLKCRYLEDAMLHLNTSNPATRAHLPTVVQEVRKHLSRFLQSYPSHVASRRIRLIIMAAKSMII